MGEEPIFEGWIPDEKKGGYQPCDSRGQPVFYESLGLTKSGKGDHFDGSQRMKQNYYRISHKKEEREDSLRKRSIAS